MHDNVGRELRFRALFAEHQEAVRRYVFHRGLWGADAEDLVAATFEVAWRRLDDVPADGALPWLFTVAHNHWRNHLRRERRRGDLLHRLPLPVPQAAPEPPDVELAAIVQALRSLSDDDREVLVLVAWDGLTPQEASVVLGCSGTALRSRLRRARNRLADKLGIERVPAGVGAGAEGHR